MFSRYYQKDDTSIGFHGSPPRRIVLHPFIGNTAIQLLWMFYVWWRPKTIKPTIVYFCTTYASLQQYQ